MRVSYAHMLYLVPKKILGSRAVNNF